MNTFTDYYAILGIDANASSAEIKAAFKKLALQYHPDVYKGTDANERMGQLLRAYQTLNDTDTRRRYDMQRAEHVPSAATTSSGYTPARTGTVAGKRTKGDVSPGARRDRQRHYAFPEFFPGTPVTVDLIDYSYTLSSADAQQLVHDGLLRGLLSEQKNQSYYCHRCHHHWQEEQRASASQTRPLSCPKCHATDWSEFLLLRCMHCRAVFESEQIRYEIGLYTYGPEARKRQGELCPPYELFPLCPYCGSSHWCPSEDTRVTEIRQQAARRATLLRLLLVGAAMIALVLISVVALGIWR